MFVTDTKKLEINTIKDLAKEAIRLLEDRQALSSLKLKAAAQGRGILVNKE